MKNNKKCQKSVCKPRAAFFALNSHPLTHDVTCSKFQILEIRENIVDKKLSVEHTPKGKKSVNFNSEWPQR